VDDSEIDLWAEVQDGLTEAAGVAGRRRVRGHRQARELAGAHRARRHRRREHRGRRDRAA